MATTGWRRDEKAREQEGMTGWLEMGGYGPYVWGSYAVAALVILALLAWSWRRLRAAKALLARLEQSAPRRAAADRVDADHFDEGDDLPR
jgi:heme exporter protein D